jgi:hypothetical protein
MFIFVSICCICTRPDIYLDLGVGFIFLPLGALKKPETNSQAKVSGLVKLL